MEMTEEELYLETDVSLHSHCGDCVRPTECRQFQGCRVIHCPENCGVRFHACKCEDHLTHICPLARVPCINSLNGCPLWMSRRETGRHLESCPASLVCCPTERNRIPLSRSAKTQMKREANCDLSTADWAAPDVQFALSDQRKIQESYRVPRSQRQKLCTSWNEFHPPIPLASASEVPRVQGDPEKFQDSSDEDEAVREKKRKLAMSPYSRECIICQYEPGSQHLHVLGSVASALARQREENAPTDDDDDPVPMVHQELPKFYKDSGLLLNLYPEFYPTGFKKKRNVYTICCNETVRRDQFPAHFENLHNDVINSLNNWLICRCPLAVYGCQEWMYRFRPENQSWTVTFSPYLDSFTVTKAENSLRDSNDSPQLNFEQLPFKILFDIVQFLDAGSLRSLSFTCKSIRQVCEELLTKMGQVERHWIKVTKENGTVSWIQQHLTWSFSKCFDRVKGWKPIPTGSMANHLAICPYLDPVIHPQERYPVLIFEHFAPKL